MDLETVILPSKASMQFSRTDVLRTTVTDCNLVSAWSRKANSLLS